MKKKKLLIVAHHMTIGGVQKSLISALKAIDYDMFDVTLYLRKNRTDLLNYVDDRVKIIVNEDDTHYYRKPYAVKLQAQIAAAETFRQMKKADMLKEKLADMIREDSMILEKNTYFKGKYYDIAIAYVQGYTALFVSDYVKAGEKIVFYHTSTDEIHSVHKRILPNFDKIVALHDEQKNLISQWYPGESSKIRIVENYIDRDFIFDESRKKQLERKDDELVLCSCGRFAQVKGFDMAVEAAKILSDKGISFKWYFVGDGPDRAKIEDKIYSYNLHKKVILTGMKKNPYPYIASCDIYVQPSYEEALGLTILEAHRLSRPVISTKTVGGMKLVENGVNGLLCNIDAVSIAQAVEALGANKEAYNSIVANLKNTDYSQEFSKYQQQWKDLLEE